MTADARKLLGGYATGTLTEEERQALFAAALEDQELFNALAEEETLRQYLGDPQFRNDLQEAIVLQEAIAEPEPALHRVAAAAAPMPTAPVSQARPRPAPRRPMFWTFASAAGIAAMLVTAVWLRTRPAREVNAVPQVVAIEHGPGPKMFEPPKAAVSKPKQIPAVEPPPVLYAQRNSPLPAALRKALPEPTPAPAKPAEPLKVAVLNFASGPKPEVGESVSQAFAEQLRKDPAYSVIDKSHFASAPSTPEEAAKIGRELGADAVVMGQVANQPPLPPPAGVVGGVQPFAPRRSAAPQASSKKSQPTVSATLVDSATAKARKKIVAVHLQDAKSTAAALTVALTSGGEGHVTDVNGAILTLDIGTRAGVLAGHQFRILHGEEDLGLLTITTAAESFSVGHFAGQGKPAAGDGAVITTVKDRP